MPLISYKNKFVGIPSVYFNCQLVTECDSDTMMRKRKRENSGKIRNLNTKIEISK